MSRQPSPSWTSEGMEHRLQLGPIVAEVVPNADRSGWIWEVRCFRARRSTATLARSYTGAPHALDAKREAEDMLLNLAASIQRVVLG